MSAFEDRANEYLGTAERIVDRAVAVLAPGMAARRLANRKLLERFTGHEAGGKNRRTEGWRTASTSPNAALDGDLVTMRDRARDLVRNQPYARKAKRGWVSKAVGAGINCQWDDPRVQAAWDRWAKKKRACDADGRSRLHGLTELAAGAIVESGEVLVRRIIQPGASGLEVPLQIRVLESDMLDHTRDFDVAPGGGGWIRQGVEFAGNGTRSAYWLYDMHPGEAGLLRSLRWESRRVPASEVIHAFRLDRPGQIRGVSWFAPSMLYLRDTDDYLTAEMMRKKIETSLSAIVSRASGRDGPGLGLELAGGTDTDDEPRAEQLEMGMITYVGDGDVSLVDPKISPNLEPFMRVLYTAIAAGLDTTYTDMTGDMSQANFSSNRMGQLQLRPSVASFQQLVLIDGFLEEVADWWHFAAGLAGAIPTGASDMRKWGAPALPMVDPLKEAQALEILLRGGLGSWKRAVAEMGLDPEELYEEIVEWKRRNAAEGVVLDTDANQTAGTGVEQSSARSDGSQRSGGDPGGEVEPEEEPDDEDDDEEEVEDAA